MFPSFPLELILFMGIKNFEQVVDWASAGTLCPENESGSKKINIINKDANFFLPWLKSLDIGTIWAYFTTFSIN
jgi:hypothetical protein